MKLYANFNKVQLENITFYFLSGKKEKLKKYTFQTVLQVFGNHFI